MSAECNLIIDLLYAFSSTSLPTEELFRNQSHEYSKKLTLEEIMTEYTILTLSTYFLPPLFQPGGGSDSGAASS